MRISEEKISHISNILKESVWKDDLVEYSDERKILNLTKKILTDYCKIDEEIDQIVRKKLQSYSRDIGEGSREWDVLYQKHFNEEIKKRWR